MSTLRLGDAPPRLSTKGTSRRAGLRTRVLAGLAAAACLAMLVVASQLRPQGGGHGTHTQLGLPPCTWAESLGKPCMTCGMTTAVAYAAHGELIDSVRTQPFGFLVAVGAAATVWGALHVAVTGSMLASGASGLLTPRVLWGTGGLVLLAWAYKVLTWNG